MTSLRNRLVVQLLSAVVLVGVVAAAIAYGQVDRRARQLMDEQLQQIARIQSAQRGVAPATAAPDDEEIQVGVWGADGSLEYASSSLLTQPVATADGFRDATLGGMAYRVYTSHSRERTIEVAQPIDIREDQAEAAALGAFGPILVLVPVLLGAILLVVRAVLRPVRKAATAVAQRDVFAAEQLPTAGLPREIAPLVDEINRLLERQNEAVRRERDFLSDAAHALRTPIAALQLQADVLDGSPDPEERARRLAALRSGIQRTARLSDQLLSVARIDAAANPRPQSLELNDVLREVADPHGVIVDSPRELNVAADHRSLYLILSNLVENAIRYTPPGGKVTVEVREHGRCARIRVSDEGPGLPEAELTRVFERFYRAAEDKSGGTGLGLSTVEALVRHLHGSVALLNRSDRSGLVAEVLLPLHAA